VLPAGSRSDRSLSATTRRSRRFHASGGEQVLPDCLSPSEVRSGHRVDQAPHQPARRPMAEYKWVRPPLCAPTECEAEGM